MTAETAPPLAERLPRVLGDGHALMDPDGRLGRALVPFDGVRRTA